MSGYSESIAALKAEYEQRLAEKEAENARLRGASKKLQERALEQAREYERYLNEYISVKLFKDNDRYKDDVYVAVNGQNCIIKRGEWVRVKRKFALVLDASEIQDMRTAEFIYEERCHRAAQMVDGLIKQKGIMAIVTSRVKDPDRLQEKLIRRDRDEGKNYQSFEDIYRNIPDLMGIRVALYFPNDAQKIAGILAPQFEIVRSKVYPARIDEYDSYRDQGFTAYKRRVYPGYEGRRFDGYCAVHHHVRFAHPDGETPELDPVIEIQVASLLMHAWSEATVR